MSLTCDKPHDYYRVWHRQPCNNKWIRFPKFHCTAYLRVPLKGRYLSPDEPTVPCLDLAAMEVDEPDRHRGNGLAFLESMEDLAAGERLVLYIEAINVPWIHTALLSRGYTELESDKRTVYKDFLGLKPDKLDGLCLACESKIPECGSSRQCAECGKTLPLCCPGRACAAKEPPQKKIRTSE